MIQDFWDKFVQTGDIKMYLAYKNMLRSQENEKKPEKNKEGHSTDKT